MTHYRVVSRREALQQLEELYDFIACGLRRSVAAFCDRFVSRVWASRWLVAAWFMGGSK